MTASKALVFDRRPERLIGFALAMGIAGLVCLPLAWVLGDGVHLADEFGLTYAVVAGGLLLATGALINDACLLGTLSRIGHGEIRFLGVLPGLALGFLAAGYADLAASAPGRQNALSVPTPTGYAIVAAFALMSAAAWWLLGRLHAADRPGRLQIRTTMLILGITGTLLFTLDPGWTYAENIRQFVGEKLMSGTSLWLMTTVGVSTIIGAAASGLWFRTFRYRRPSTLTFVRSVAGGAVMAFGATLVPGGNDSLLLWSLPSATVTGLAAYTIMSATVLAVLGLVHLWRKRSLVPAIAT